VKKSTLLKLMVFSVIILLLCLSIILIVQEKPKQETGSLEVFFCPETNCTAVFMQHTQNAKCVFYDVDEPMNDYLKKQGIPALIFEENYKDYGIAVSSKGLMHNKFCFTNETVVTGSFNPTVREELHNNNNVVVLHSVSLAKNYAAAFENIKNKQSKKTPHPKITFSNFTIENYFCPKDNCKEHVLQALQKANSSIHFMTFSFTDDDIGNLLVEKSKRIPVQGIMEKSQNSSFSEFEKLQNSNIAVEWDNNNYTMHHKVFIIDSAIVITGSYNPTRNGDEFNDENVLIIHNAQVAQWYLTEFERIKP